MVKVVKDGTAETQIGWRMRQLRQQRRLSQTEVAGALGISPSYLNLIEHGRRRVSVDLLMAVSGYFGIEPGDLAEQQDAALVGELMEALGDEMFADSAITNIEVRDLAVSSPTAAKAFLRLYSQYRSSRRPEAGQAEEAPVFHSATERVADFLQTSSNHFDLLERAAERVRADIDHISTNYDYGLETYLANVFGVQVELGSLPSNVALSASAGRLTIADNLPAETSRFLVSHHLATLTTAEPIEAVLDAFGMESAEVRLLARNALAGYVAGALIMPYERFYRACRDYRYDLDRLSRRFGASFEQVCHRTTTLQRNGMSGIPLHLVRTDVAGNISKRFSLSGIHIPRHSGACPKWNIYSAFQSPDRINVQISETPDQQRYFCIARTVSKVTGRHNALQRYLSIGLGCSITHARQMVYADGLDLDANIVKVGSSCRVCPRLECDHRAHPPSHYQFAFDETVRPVSIYARMK
ncbi:MAG TPA: short-chain fatty acyl-CoA regulator family protein [Devosia sp.]|nr:short-chain fatty acyl-CoA regulator family protein [Devosia sp.]